MSKGIEKVLLACDRLEATMKRKFRLLTGMFIFMTVGLILLTIIISVSK